MSAAFFNRFNDFRRRGLIYPSPFFDIAQTYMPPTVKELFKWCKYYFYTHPIINPVVYKMAEYPITDLIYQEHKHEDGGSTSSERGEPDDITTEAYQQILEEYLDIKSFLINCGLDFFTYGNCFVSISFPFVRMLACMSCKHAVDIKSLTYEKWEYKNQKFYMSCPECGTQGQALKEDRNIIDKSEIRLLRWDPDNINITYYPTNGRSTYTYAIPKTMASDIRIGKHDAVVETPQEYLDAVHNNKDIKFTKENFFHLKRATLAEQDQGWGKPLIMPAMRDAFYLQVLRKANEAIAMQYIVPLTVLFPQPHGNIDPYKHMNLGRWRERVEQEIAAWKDDPNHIPIMPIPVGNQQIFGTGKALMVTPEIRALSEQMVTGMSVPTEFIFGGLSYSGSSVSLRIVENHLLRYREGMLRLMKFIVDRIRKYAKLPKINIKFQDFKMADDIQQQQLIASFMQAKYVSVRTGLQQLGFQFKDEEDKILEESEFTNELAKDQLIAQAEAQGEGSVIMAKYQAEAERTLMEQQMVNQNAMLQQNPSAAQYLMQAQAAQGAAAGGAPVDPSAQVPPVGPPMAPEAAPDQTQSHTGPQPPQQGGSVQPGYGHGMEERVIDPRLLALHIAAQLNATRDPARRQAYMSQLKTDMPHLSGLTLDVLKNQKQYATEPNMPTMRPPRRKGGSPM